MIFNRFVLYLFQVLTRRVGVYPTKGCCGTMARVAHSAVHSTSAAQWSVFISICFTAHSPSTWMANVLARVSQISRAACHSTRWWARRPTVQNWRWPVRWAATSPYRRSVVWPCLDHSNSQRTPCSCHYPCSSSTNSQSSRHTEWTYWLCFLLNQILGCEECFACLRREQNKLIPSKMMGWIVPVWDRLEQTVRRNSYRQLVQSEKARESVINLWEKESWAETKLYVESNCFLMVIL